MPGALDVLERRVAAAADLICGLRSRVALLETELSAAGPPCAAAPSANADPELLAELERLRAERVLVRERIHRLLEEFDKVSW